MPILTVRLPNAVEVAGPTEAWVAAILQILTPDQRDQVLSKVAGQDVRYRTPGSYILHAEMGNLGMLLGGRR